MNALALCAGIGGLELALDMATGGRARPVCYVERDAYAAAVLLARMEDEALGRAPIWDDLTTFDARPWRGVVDLVAAGFPCQPWSVAGKRKGTADARWIWPDIARIVSECEPGLVFLENVPGLYRHGLRAVLSDLAALGFDAEWTCVSAADVGAPHRRERVFILAYRQGWSTRGTRSGQTTPDDPESLANSSSCTRSAEQEHEHGERPREPRGGYPAMANAISTDLQQAAASWSDRKERGVVTGTGAAVAHASLGGPARIGRSGEAGAAERGEHLEHAERPRLGGPGHPGPQWQPFPPAPGDADGWRDYLAAGGPEPAVRRSADGLPDRLDRLRCLGNGVVPQQAALAFRSLMERIA